MTVTVFVDYEVSREFVIPNVNSLEEAEGVALEMLEDELGNVDYEVIGMDSFEGGEEEVQ